MSNEHASNLKKSLDLLTDAISPPVVSGEMVGWVEAVADALRDVESAWLKQVEWVHPGMYDSISSEDAELLAPVERMQQEDQKVLAEVQTLIKQAERLTAASERVEPSENVLNERIQRLSDEALALFGRIKRQEAAVSTWLQESLQRDRGAVD